MEENKTYILDLNRISEFVFGDTTERTHDTEITEIYEPEEEIEETEVGVTIKRSQSPTLNLVNRTIREVKGSDDSGKFSVKYDMIKMFINMLDEDTFDSNKLTIGQRLAFNTMLSYGLIKEL